MTKIAFISDTHNCEVEIEPSDIVCHTGDATNQGSLDEIKNFISWYRHVEAPIKLFVPGNHDFLCESDPALAFTMFKDANILMLDGRSYNHNKLKFYGHPWVPKFYNWAFMPTLAKRQARIDKIPKDTDILLCHGPPYNMLDFNGHMPCGDHQLADKVFKIQPKICAFGHIHEGYGYKKCLKTIYINSALCPNMNYYHKDQTPIYVYLDNNKKINDIKFHKKE